MSAGEEAQQQRAAMQQQAGAHAAENDDEDEPQYVVGADGEIDGDVIEDLDGSGACVVARADVF